MHQKTPHQDSDRFGLRGLEKKLYGRAHPNRQARAVGVYDLNVVTS